MTTTLALIGIGFALSLLAGLLVGFLADFPTVFGRTVAVGMLSTAVVIIVLLAIATVRSNDESDEPHH